LNITDELFQARKSDQPVEETETRIVELARKLSDIL